MTTEATLKLLWDCASALDPETHTNKLLKSHYINTCRKIARNNIQVPKERFAVSQMCSRCSALWCENDFRLKLRPQALANSVKAKRLLAKLDEANSTQRKGLLTKKQRRRAKWLRKRVCSNVQITCENCQHKTLLPLQKPSTKTAESAKLTEEQETAVLPTPKSKKKKNKNKNKNAGLILKPTPKSPSAAAVATTKTQRVEAFKPHALGNPFAVPTPSAKVTLSSAAATASPSLNQTLKAKKPKNKKNKSAAAVPQPPTKKSCAPTVQSKTQQKNSLLQLAALLKTQAQKPSSTQNRLESLLK